MPFRCGGASTENPVNPHFSQATMNATCTSVGLRSSQFMVLSEQNRLQDAKVSYHGFCSISRCLKASGPMGSAVSSNWSAKRRIKEQIQTQNPLESAHLPSMGLTAVPNMSKLCPLISSLDLSNNIITDLPEHLQRFPNLTLLNISNNQLCTLPVFLSAVIQLKDLRASDNNIRKLPEALILPGLSTLTLCRNYLNQGLSPLLCQSFKSSLHVLHLSSNGLMHGVATRTILMLSALVELDLSLNNMGGDLL